jgi:hypothetical protein
MPSETKDEICNPMLSK